MGIDNNYLTSKCIYFIDEKGNYKPLGTPSEITLEEQPYDELKLNILGAFNAEEYFFMKMNKHINPNETKIVLPLPERYIINKDATILMWQDGTKTIVRRCADDEFNPRLAFLTAFFQHYCGMSKNKANKYLANLQVEEAREVKEKKKTQKKPKHMKEEKGFKVGDKVKVIKGDFFSEKNWIGTIIEEKIGLFLIEYNNGLSWYVAPKQIKLIKEGK